MSGPVLDQAAVGAHVRRLRKAARLSVRAFAEVVGFSASFISQLENGQVSPSIHSMEKIAVALGTTLGAFFVALQPAGHPPIARARDRRSAESAWSRARVETLGPLPPESRFEPLVITLRAGGRSGKHPDTHPRQQFALVLEGRPTLHLGDAVHQLAEGDAVVLKPNDARLWLNRQRRRCRVLVVALVD